MSSPRTYNLDVASFRGELIESRHRIHSAVFDSSGTLLGSSGDPTLVTYWRSCAKPFQAMPVLRSGCFERHGWGADELALACASHGGEPEHVALARSMLDALGLDEGDLACGVHTPLSTRGARLAERSGAQLGRLHNNCSGKHAAMLALALERDWTLLGYERQGHLVQRVGLQTVAEWTGVPRHKLLQGVDGCGVVTFGLPIEAMALAFARLSHAAAQGQEVPARIVDAMRTRPFLVGGTDRFDTVLMEETAGRVLAKVGAEGVHTVALLDRGIGAAVKAEDGSTRAQQPAVLRLLQHLEALPDPLPPRLAALMRSAVMNTRGEEVGVVRPLE